MSSGLSVTRKTIYFDRTPTNYLLVNLAVADIIVALFITPQFILIHSFKHPGGLIGTVLCKLLTGGTFMWLGATTSAFTMVVIAFERYYAVLHPHSIKGKMTNSKLKVSVAVIRKRQNHHHHHQNKEIDYVMGMLNELTVVSKVFFRGFVSRACTHSFSWIRKQNDKSLGKLSCTHCLYY